MFRFVFVGAASLHLWDQRFCGHASSSPLLQNAQLGSIPWSSIPLAKPLSGKYPSESTRPRL